MNMPGRKYSVGSEVYRYGFNGQEKSIEIAEGLTTAEYWEYDSRIGRRWNVDPKPQINLSDYSVLGNNPVINVDPNGDLFFGLFGSTSEQRQSAKKLQAETGGKINNLYKKNINVQYKSWVSEDENSSTFLQKKASDQSILPSIVSQNFRTYFDRKTGNQSGTDYYESTFGSWRKYESVQAYEPDKIDKWSKSENIVAKISYGLVNSSYMVGQVFFTRRFTNNPTTSLTGELTNNTENLNSFIDLAMTFMPYGKGAKGLTYLEKLNAAQFSKFFKGTALARAAPIVRGKLNVGLNYIFSQYNKWIPSGKFLIPVLKKLKPEE